MKMACAPILIAMAMSLAACDDEKPKNRTEKAFYSEQHMADMGNGCSLYSYAVTPVGDRYPDKGRYVLCESGAQTGSTHARSCGKSTCDDSTAVVGDPIAIKRAAAFSKLSQEERALLGVK